MFTANIQAVGNSLGLSALVATIPLLAFFVMLLGVKARAHVSALVALAVSILVAVVGFTMPLGLSAYGATVGAVHGLVICWVILGAIWFYQITVLSGRFEDLRRTFDILGGGDLRIQAILIAFCFGGLLEALAGFGAPVAITATMILALGVKPLKAATAVLIANTAPVAFGAVAVPIDTAGQVGGKDPQVIATIVGHQAPLLAIFVPVLLLFVLDGIQGVKDAWLPALVIGISFGAAQWLTASTAIYNLTDVVACIASMTVAVLFLQVWKPRGIEGVRERNGLPAASEKKEELPAVRIWMAVLPYLIVVAIFGVANLWKELKKTLGSVSVTYRIDDLANAMVDKTGKAVSAGQYKFTWLSNPGTLLIISGLIVAVIYFFFNENGKYGFKFPAIFTEFGSVVHRMRWTIVTIASVLALAYVMNLSGQTVAMGTFLASLGVAYAFLAPALGWIGTAVTGSDTSANALFSKLQVSASDTLHAAGVTGATPELMLAANTTGGVVGKMISPQSLAIAATSVDMEGKESDIFKAVVPWSFAMLVVVCALVFLQTNVLHFMIP
ncbi:MAG: L-lactate permease [Rothia sp. (in: high G+C Gram-positive bacteria)]|uniref:L-lactate permease n=1 Tax=Rothia sp. (in: high G+C Gram-positive bacteria) TaxID=1885016 RepID=UPI0026E0F087|nr:L-lactate permease [Rothia sp. (in: high G+C Gram-positive bacteria)]MDO5749859.1 L-lactate permease [Rothia sp. (in: high G+C Gram-positive bacteria)]